MGAGTQAALFFAEWRGHGFVRKVFLWSYADDTTYHGLHRVCKVEELPWRLAVLLRML